MKKFIVIIIVLTMITSSSVYADESYIDLSDILIENNNNLAELKIQTKKMDITVQSTLISSKGSESTYKDLLDLPFPVGNDVLLGLRYSFIIAPKQVGYSEYVLENNLELAMESTKFGLRDLISGYINLENSVELLKKKIDYYSSKYTNDNAKYDLGLISQSDLNESRVKKIEMEYSYNQAKRNFEDMNRNLNNLLGISLETEHEIRREDKLIAEFDSVDILVENALKNRFELKDINKQIELQQAIADFYDYGDYLTVYSNYKSRRQALNKVDELELQYKIKSEEITREIYAALELVKIEDIKIDKMIKTIEKQKTDLNVLKEQEEIGYLTEDNYKELEFAIIELEGLLETMIYSYNTKLLKLFSATNLGPAY